MCRQVDRSANSKSSARVSRQVCLILISSKTQILFLFAELTFTAGVWFLGSTVSVSSKVVKSVTRSSINVIGCALVIIRQVGFPLVFSRPLPNKTITKTGVIVLYLRVGLGIKQMWLDCMFNEIFKGTVSHSRGQTETKPLMKSWLEAGW